MRPINRALVALFTSLLILPPPSALAAMQRGKAEAPKAHKTQKAPKAPHTGEELLVKLTPGAASGKGSGLGSAAQQARGFRVPKGLGNTDIARWRVVKINKNQNVRDVAARLRKNPNVEVVEYNYLLTLNSLPNDPDFGQLWGLHNTGATGGTPGADIAAVDAWQLGSSTDAEVTVAVIDTGVDYLHPDLADNMWVNAGEIPDNGIDDDGNGFVDDVHGYDFANYDADPNDDHGHGTHVAGTIAAVGNNETGIIGIAPGAKIMAIKFLSASGGGTTEGAIDAVLYATQMGAQISNNSWGGGAYSQALFDAIAAAEQANSLFVAAAGNNGMNTDGAAHYPSNYDLPNIVSVAATDHNDELAYFSNYGETTVDLAAPGVDIYSAAPGGLYQNMSGTSMAAPHVSGVAALVASVYSDSSYTFIRDRLLGSTDVKANLQGMVITDGRLNARNALEDDDVPPDAVTELTVNGATGSSLALSWLASGDDGYIGAASSYEIRYTTVAPTAPEVFENAPFQVVAGGIESGYPVSATLKGLTQGTGYYIAVIAIDNAGNRSPISLDTYAETATLTPVFYYDTESEPVGWMIEGSDGMGGPALWHRSQFRYGSPVTGWYYGQEATLDYDTGASNQGSLTSPEIDLRGVDSPLLSFVHSLQTEGGGFYDQALVEVSANGDPWTQVWQAPNTSEDMHLVEIDLADYTDNVVRVRFSFDTMDEILNNFSGWSIDDFTILGAGEAEEDNTPPGQVMDLHAEAVSNGIQLMWTATGDDDDVGTASKYDLRYSTEPIFDTTFDDATAIDGMPKPAPAGAMEEFLFTNSVPGTTYYFAMRVYDNVQLVSPLSNVASATAFAGKTVLFKDGFEHGAGAWTFEGSDGIGGPGLWGIDGHRTGSGEQALYYGIPGQNNFDTGVRNFGTATSAMIDLAGVAEAELSFVDFREAEPGDYYDQTHVLISVDNGYSWELLYDRRGEEPVPEYPDTGMTLHTVSLNAYEGMQVQLRFSFDTVDEVGNEFEGWVVDDVRVEATVFDGQNRPPQANVGGPYKGMPGEPIQFDGRGSFDPEGKTLSYEWDFGDGAVSNEPTPQHTFMEEGEYQVALIVNDGELWSDVSVIDVFVGNLPPTAVISGPAETARNETVTFSAAGSSDPEGESLQFQWWLNGEPAGNTVALKHIFYEPGDYHIMLEVYDGYHMAMTEHSVSVINYQPAAIISGPTQGSKQVPVTFDGSQSWDSDGDPLEYQWHVNGELVGNEPSLTYTFPDVGVYEVMLNVSDGFDTGTASVPFEVANGAPQAAIEGPAQVNRKVSITYDGSTSTDPDGDPLTYSWKVDGELVGSESTLSVTFDEPGPHQVELTVADGTASDTVGVQVEVVNQTPTAEIAGASSAFRNEALTFDGSGSSDPDGDALTYSWTLGSASGELLGTSSSLNYTFEDAGMQTLVLTISDGYASATATHVIEISNRAPVAEFSGPSEVFINSAGDFSGAASTDADGDPLSYSWFLNGELIGTTVELTHVFTEVGIHQIELQVNDGDQLGSLVRTVDVINRAPDAAISGPSTIHRGETAMFSSSASDADGQPLTYQWSVDGAAAGTGPSMSRAFNDSRIYLVALEVSDGYTETRVEHEITITNTAPTVNISGPSEGNAVDAVAFTAEATDADGDALSYQWYVDGVMATDAPELTRVFENKTSYTIKLVVSDGELSATAEHSVAIINIAPVADAGPDQVVSRWSSVTLSGSASLDRDGTIASFHWQQIRGDAVQLSGNGSDVTFDAPKVRGNGEAVLDFQLTVTDNDGATSTDVVSVVVTK